MKTNAGWPLPVTVKAMGTPSGAGTDPGPAAVGIGSPVAGGVGSSATGAGGSWVPPQATTTSRASTVIHFMETSSRRGV
jgi:hypothetical protein